MSDRIVLMAHLVAGYPDASGCRAAARGLVEGGASILEVQIPFSDPSADGPSIRDACARSLAGGTRVADAFAFVAELRAEFPAVPVFLMAYASLVATPGAPAFCAAARKAGVAGLIVPDLPYDADEGLAAACAAEGLASVPVAAPSMRRERLAAMASLGRPWLYAALRAGITGAATEVGEDTKSFLAAAAVGGSKVLGGFGIRTGAQARSVAPYVHAVVAGSVFVDAISAAVAAQDAGRTPAYSGSPRVRDEAIRRAVGDRAREITGV
ncbi:MAG TPA: tryptophan synthase subunit alpha [Treponema sp.]|nr:MAG: tryptophan synthase subunit alpha [Treponema sp. GWA1_62_8]OHE66305.1 MAG: tryptophan synthase subunit alpha [Treponema sp. GWC1_61_84]HCM26151.1 tryptophan synthase subunit alpha [Treponema sp.]